MKQINKIWLWAVGLMLLPFQMVSAHVKWFVPSEEVTAMYHSGPLYGLYDTPVVIWTVLLVVGLFVARYLDKIIPEPKKLVAFGKKHEAKIIWAFQVLVGIFLLAISIGWKIVLVPEVEINSQVTGALQILQILVAGSFILNFKPRWGAVGLLLTYLGVTALEGAMFFLENMLIGGIGAFVFLWHTPETSAWYKIRNRAVSTLRISAGISLIVLAFTEKFWYPELSLYFLQTHQWNFMQLFGFSGFTNELFVLSTGFAETLFGLLFVFGYVTRINTVAIATFFAFSVTAMAIGFGMWEVEDMVIYAAAIIFLAYGSGKQMMLAKT